MKKFIIVVILLLATVPAYVFINVLLERSRMSYDNVAQNGEDISIVVKFGKPSSGLRFIVYDNQTRQVIGSSKCAHGSGGGSTTEHPVFSNKVGSNCSSLGTYRLRSISKMYNCDMDCIRLEGLSPTNSNAAARGIYIHTAPIVADVFSTGFPIPVSPIISQGCFGISTETFNQLCALLREGKTIYLYADDERIE